MTLNQHLLNALGAGHERIDQVIRMARDEGHAAKLVGAGGGGCVIVHLREGEKISSLSPIIESL